MTNKEFDEQAKLITEQWEKGLQENPDSISPTARELMESLSQLTKAWQHLRDVVCEAAEIPPDFDPHITKPTMH